MKKINKTSHRNKKVNEMDVLSPVFPKKIRDFTLIELSTLVAWYFLPPALTFSFAEIYFKAILPLMESEEIGQFLPIELENAAILLTPYSTSINHLTLWPDEKNQLVDIENVEPTHNRSRGRGFGKKDKKQVSAPKSGPAFASLSSTLKGPYNFIKVPAKFLIHTAFKGPYNFMKVPAKFLIHTTSEFGPWFNDHDEYFVTCHDFVIHGRFFISLRTPLKCTSGKINLLTNVVEQGVREGLRNSVQLRLSLVCGTCDVDTSKSILHHGHWLHGAQREKYNNKNDILNPIYYSIPSPNKTMTKIEAIGYRDCIYVSKAEWLKLAQKEGMRLVGDFFRKRRQLSRSRIQPQEKKYPSTSVSSSSVKRFFLLPHGQDSDTMGYRLIDTGDRIHGKPVRLKIRNCDMIPLPKRVSDIDDFPRPENSVNPWNSNLRGGFIPNDANSIPNDADSISQINEGSTFGSDRLPEPYDKLDVLETVLGWCRLKYGWVARDDANLTNPAPKEKIIPLENNLPKPGDTGLWNEPHGSIDAPVKTTDKEIERFYLVRDSETGECIIYIKSTGEITKPMGGKGIGLMTAETSDEVVTRRDPQRLVLWQTRSGDLLGCPPSQDLKMLPGHTFGTFIDTDLRTEFRLTGRSALFIKDYLEDKRDEFKKNEEALYKLGQISQTIRESLEARMARAIKSGRPIVWMEKNAEGEIINAHLATEPDTFNERIDKEIQQIATKSNEKPAIDKALKLIGRYSAYLRGEDVYQNYDVYGAVSAKRPPNVYAPDYIRKGDDAVACDVEYAATSLINALSPERVDIQSLLDRLEKADEKTYAEEIAHDQKQLFSGLRPYVRLTVLKQQSSPYYDQDTEGKFYHTVIEYPKLEVKYPTTLTEPPSLYTNSIPEHFKALLDHFNEKMSYEPDEEVDAQERENVQTCMTKYRNIIAGKRGADIHLPDAPDPPKIKSPGDINFGGELGKLKTDDSSDSNQPDNFNDFDEPDNFNDFDEPDNFNDFDEPDNFDDFDELDNLNGFDESDNFNGFDEPDNLNGFDENLFDEKLDEYEYSNTFEDDFEYQIREALSEKAKTGVIGSEFELGDQNKASSISQNTLEDNGVQAEDLPLINLDLEGYEPGVKDISEITDISQEIANLLPPVRFWVPLISIEEIDQGLSTEKTDQDMSTEKTDQGISTEKTDRGMSTEKTDQGISTEETDQGLSTEKTDQATEVPEKSPDDAKIPETDRIQDLELIKSLDDFFPEELDKLFQPYPASDEQNRSLSGRKWCSDELFKVGESNFIGDNAGYFKITQNEVVPPNLSFEDFKSKYCKDKNFAVSPDWSDLAFVDKLLAEIDETYSLEEQIVYREVIFDTIEEFLEKLVEESDLESEVRDRTNNVTLRVTRGLPFNWALKRKINKMFFARTKEDTDEYDYETGSDVDPWHKVKDDADIWALTNVDYATNLEYLSDWESFNLPNTYYSIHPDKEYMPQIPNGILNNGTRKNEDGTSKQFLPPLRGEIFTSQMSNSAGYQVDIQNISSKGIGFLMLVLGLGFYVPAILSVTAEATETIFQLIQMFFIRLRKGGTLVYKFRHIRAHENSDRLSNVVGIPDYLERTLQAMALKLTATPERVIEKRLINLSIKTYLAFTGLITFDGFKVIGNIFWIVLDIGRLGVVMCQIFFVPIRQWGRFFLILFGFIKCLLPKDLSCETTSPEKFWVENMVEYVKRVDVLKYFYEVFSEINEYRNDYRTVPKYLFVGESGNGKTFIIRSLAGECGMDMYTFPNIDITGPRGATMTAKPVLEAKGWLMEFFKLGRQVSAAPILLLEDLQELNLKRKEHKQRITQTKIDTVNHRIQLTIFTQLLVEIDGFSEMNDTNVTHIYGTGTSIRDLDVALLRPGRFGDVFFLTSPSTKARQDVLVNYVNSWFKTPFMRTCDWSGHVVQLTLLTTGFTHYDVHRIMGRAQLHFLAKQRDSARAYTTAEEFKSAHIDFIQNLIDDETEKEREVMQRVTSESIKKKAIAEDIQDSDRKHESFLDEFGNEKYKTSPILIPGNRKPVNTWNATREYPTETEVTDINTSVNYEFEYRNTDRDIDISLITKENLSSIDPLHIPYNWDNISVYAPKNDDKI